MWRRLGLVFVVITLLYFFSIRSVSAHANLSRSNPSANASLNQSLAEIRLWFTETLEPRFSHFVLRDVNGSGVTTRSSQVDSTDPTQMFIEPGELPDGLYTVVWRVVSTDGHSTEGSLAFGVRIVVTNTTILPPVDETVPVESAVIRWLNLLSLSLAVGSVAFYIFVWMPAVPEGHLAIERRMVTLMWIGWAMLGITDGIRELKMALKIMLQRGKICVREHYLIIPYKKGTAYSWLIILALLATLVILTGCRQSNAISDAGKTVQISLAIEPSPPIIGETVLTVTLLSDRGEPIEGASLQVRGDMSHAGMAPEFGEVETADGGNYRIPFKWTMGGDWILTITATLASGETVKDTFKFTVE